MRKALIYHADREVSARLRVDMEKHGWNIDACGGMLELLRLIQESDYDIVVLSSDRMNVELSTLIGTVRNLREKPRILINLAGTIDSLAIVNLARNGTVIRGKLTPEKFIEAAGEKFPEASGGILETATEILKTKRGILQAWAEYPEDALA